MTDGRIPSDRDIFIAEVRKALRARSGKAWSVTGGRGTAWGWVRIISPPARRIDGAMTPEDAAELSALLGLEFFPSAHHQGVNVPSQSDYRREYLARAKGETPDTIGVPAWD